MTALVVRITLLYLAGLVAWLVGRRSTAAMRHLVCICALAGSLVLPLAALLPSRVIALPLVSTSAVSGASRAMARAAAWHSSSLLVWLWAIGAMFLLLRLAIGYWRMRRVIGSAEPIGAGALAADVNVPVACGLLRPVVLIPRAAAEWPEWQHAAALRHERAHIERRDLLANFLAGVACAVYWFHPLTWVLSSLLRREQETACDDTVLGSGFEPAIYAEALLAVARNSTSTLIPGCAMTTQIDVKNRILRLLDRSIARTTSPKTLRFAALVFAGLVIAIGIPIRAQEPYRVGGDVSAPQVLSKVDPQYTEEARHAKIAGSVLLRVVVGTDGVAHDITIVKSLDPGLDRNAAEAIEKWHFTPGMRKGEAVPVQAVIEVNFRLQ